MIMIYNKKKIIFKNCNCFTDDSFTNKNIFVHFLDNYS